MMDGVDKKHRSELVLEVKNGGVSVTKNRFGHEGDLVSPLILHADLLRQDRAFYFVQVTEESPAAAAGSLRPIMGMSVNNPGVQGPLMEALDKVKGCGPSREFSLVRTKIEEALLWLKAAERGDAF